MSLFGQKPGTGLSINTTAANAGGGGLFGGGSSNQPQSTGSLFGSTPAASQPAAPGGLFGSSTQTTQPASAGGLFSNVGASKPAQTGGLFGNNAQTTQAGTLFGNTQPAQPAQTGGGLFGAAGQTAASQPAQSGGLFANAAKPQQQAPGSLFGAAPQASTNQQQSGFSFGLGAKPNTTNPSSSLLGGPTLGASTNNAAQGSNQASGAKIDLEHLRTTTRYEQLTDDLQKEIEVLDTFILQQMTFSHEVTDLLPLIIGAGANVPNDVTFVSDKLEELELGLENDATEINNLRDTVVAKDAAEAKLCFRGVDRLKLPAQYQQQQYYQSVNGASTGGLSGWWNHPQTRQRSVRGSNSAGGRINLQLPGDDDEESKGPSNLIEFFEKRTAEMTETLSGYKNIMQDIEGHLDSVEMTIAAKQRELNDSRSSGGVMGRGADEQVRNLRYALGVFERSIYDAAEQIGNARDGVQELILGKAQIESRLGQSRIAWWSDKKDFS